MLNVIKSIYEPAVRGTERTVINPPGRAPRPELVRLSAWYNAQDAEAHAMIRQIIERAADMAVFGFLAALNGEANVG